MKTLIVYFSKTGNTKTIADKLKSELNCDTDEIIYDEANKSITCSLNPSEYEHVIIMSPIWAMSLAEPTKLWLNKYGREVKSYSVIITCSLGFGLGGSVRTCKSAIGKAPTSKLKVKSKDIPTGNYSLSNVVSGVKK